MGWGGVDGCGRWGGWGGRVNGAEGGEVMGREGE